MDIESMAAICGLYAEGVATLEKIFREVTAPGRRRRVTSFLEWNGFWVKNVLDALLAPSSTALGGLRIVDIGSGGGFPGIVLAVRHPDSEVFLVEASACKCATMDAAISATGISNVRVIRGRAEDLARNPDYRDSFDVATARALAEMPVLAELTLPFLKPGGFLMAYKGPGLHEELGRSTRAFSLLGGKVEKIENYTVSAPGFETVERTVAIIRKTRLTPAAYPRRDGVPAKQPL